jgi:hypothetical protein
MVWISMVSREYGMITTTMLGSLATALQLYPLRERCIFTKCSLREYLTSD